MFADDTNLTASGDSVPIVQAAVNSDSENLRKWLISNKLSLNVAKTEFMLIGSKSMIKRSLILNQMFSLTINKKLSEYMNAKLLD